MKHNLRWISLLCALLMVLPMLLIPASAADEVQTGKLGDAITYVFDPATGVLEVTGEGEMWDYSDYYAALALEDAENPTPGTSPLRQREQIKTILISDGITHIGAYAFEGCRSLQTLRLGKNIQSIGEFAFAFCGTTTLREVIFPAALQEVGEAAFRDSYNLTAYFLGDAPRLADWAFSGTATLYYPSDAQGWTTPEWNGYKAQPLPYSDVDLERWYGLDVMWMHHMGYMEGVGGGRFAPQATVTRAQLVTLLSRVRPDLLTENYSDDPVYSDVPADAWYAKAVCWANSAQVVRGYPDGTFRPNEPVTREQLAVMLMRCEKPEQAAPEDALDGFADAADVSTYAQSAMRWAVSNGILQGVGGDAAGPLLSPGSTATRAQLAALTARCVQLLNWDEKTA